MDTESMSGRIQYVFNRREEKFPLEPGDWERVVQCAEQYLPVEEFDGAHRVANIQTTYLDSADLQSYREYVEARPVRKKIRIRQYGYEGRFNGRCWVEIKIKRYEDSLKRRFCCSSEALLDLMSGRDIASQVNEANAQREEANEIYEAARKLILDNTLRPVVRVDYERMAFQSDSLPRTRITVDRRIRFRAAGQTAACSHLGTLLEVKYRGREPEWLGEFLHVLSVLEPSRFSKFARAIRALNVNNRK